jgi:hypothetical protein
MHPDDGVVERGVAKPADFLYKDMMYRSWRDGGVSISELKRGRS